MLFVILYRQVPRYIRFQAYTCDMNVLDRRLIVLPGRELKHIVARYFRTQERVWQVMEGLDRSWKFQQLIAARRARS